MKLKSFLWIVAGLILIANQSIAQEDEKKEEEKAYKFETVDDVENTSVKNQYRSGT